MLQTYGAGGCAGEYIAVEKLETDYSDTDVVEQIW
jgi:long-subunit acyl-CoA synthetase (AMP-forming)